MKVQAVKLIQMLDGSLLWIVYHDGGLDAFRSFDEPPGALPDAASILFDETRRDLILCHPVDAPDCRTGRTVMDASLHPVNGLTILIEGRGLMAEAQRYLFGKVFDADA